MYGVQMRLVRSKLSNSSYDFEIKIPNKLYELLESPTHSYVRVDPRHGCKTLDFMFEEFQVGFDGIATFAGVKQFNESNIFKFRRDRSKNPKYHWICIPESFFEGYRIPEFLLNQWLPLSDYFVRFDGLEPEASTKMYLVLDDYHGHV